MNSLLEHQLNSAQVVAKRLRNLEQVYVRGGNEAVNALRRYDEDVIFTQAVHASLRKLSANSRRAQVLCCEFVTAAPNLLQMRLLPQESIEWANTGLATAERSNDPVAIGTHFLLRGIGYRSLGKIELAAKDLEQAAEFLGGTHEALEGVALFNIGIIACQMQENDKALSCHAKALAIFEDVGYSRGIRKVVGGQTLYHLALRDYVTAAQRAEEFLRLSRKDKDSVDECTALGQVATCQRRLGNIERAIEIHAERLQIAQQIGDLIGYRNSCGNIGSAYSDLGQFEKATNYYKQAFSISKRMGDIRGEGADLVNLAVLNMDSADYSRAWDLLLEALELFRKIGDRKREAVALWNLSQIAEARNAMYVAIEFAEEALAIREAIGDPGAEAIRDSLNEWKEATDS